MSQWVAIEIDDMQKAGQCIFCGLPQTIRILAQNEHAVLIPDAYPVTSWHTLVIPRRHVPDYFDLHSDELIACNELLKQGKILIESEDSAVVGFNIGINSGEVAGQTVFHAHIHLIPRREGDVQEPEGGIRHVIPGKGCYKRR